jgi:hypothetical protein
MLDFLIVVLLFLVVLWMALLTKRELQQRQLNELILRMLVVCSGRQTNLADTVISVSDWVDKVSPVLLLFLADYKERNQK